MVQIYHGNKNKKYYVIDDIMEIKFGDFVWARLGSFESDVIHQIF